MSLAEKIGAPASQAVLKQWVFRDWIKERLRA